MTTSLQFTNVNKVFRKQGRTVHALKNVSFSVSEGEVFGFVGPNGAGKSTTIKILLDIISDYSGDVRIYDVPAHDANARRGIAYLPESPSLYERLTPLEILHSALRMYGTKKQNSERWCLEWLERLSIVESAGRRLEQLSKGTVQRVAIAHALISEPRLLILDEPLSGLDPVGRRDVIDILAEFKRNGGAIFFTSHVLHDVERIADRFGFIYEGEIITTRSPGQLLTEHADRFVVRYHSTSGAQKGGKKLREDEYEQELSQRELPGWLTNLNAQGGKVLSLTPSVTLEKVFFHILEERKAQTEV